MRTFRTILFWLHLAAGLVAGLVIGVMCLTGALLTFENELVAWAERDVRTVVLPPGEASPLPLTELTRRVQQAQPALHPPTITINREPEAAVGFGAGREITVFANPYTGEVRQPATTQMRELMRTLQDWHRFLGREGTQRPAGKAVNGVANVAFCFLALSGLYLWLPRHWSVAGVKAVALLNWRLDGKARDFNWHNAVGLWTAPVLIVLTLTALPISYRWASDGIYRLAGETPPPPAGPRASTGPMTKDNRAATTADYERIVTQAAQTYPDWRQLTLRPADQVGAPVTVTVREQGGWPRTATVTLTFDAASGAELKRETFADLSLGRRIRAWTRFLHTGQALGWIGQGLAGLASLGGCILVFTGFMLAIRRFRHRRLQATA